jgi:PAS domain S-box-containing protein
MKRLIGILRTVLTFKAMIQVLAVVLISALTAWILANLWQDNEDDLRTDLGNYQAVIVKNNTEMLSSQLVKVILQGKEMSRARMFRAAMEGLESPRRADRDKAHEDFENFVRVSGFYEGHLFNPDGKLFATTEVRFEGRESDYEEPIQRVLKSRVPFFSPLRSYSGRLVSDLFLPVFPASALSNAVAPTRILVLTVPMTETLRAFLATEQSLEYNSRIHLIQQVDDGFEETVFRYPDNLELQSVTASLKDVTSVAFGIRTGLYGEKQVYSTARLIPAIRWWIMIETDTTLLTAMQHEFELVSGLVAGLGLLALVLLVISVNFIASTRQLSRRKNTLEAELIPSRKERTMLRGFCDALPFPVTLKERTTGAYRHVNKAFAEFTGFEQADAVGITDSQVFTFADVEELDHGEQMVNMSSRTYAQELEITKGMNQTLMQVTAIPCAVSEERDSILTVFRDVTAEKQTVDQSIEIRQQIINALVRAVESVPFLDGQSALMRQLSLEVAETMLLSDADCATVEAAAILSQIGKTFVPKEIMQKDGKLTEEELLETKKYVEHTCRILEGVKFDLPITQTIWQIQENLDGSGYPRGLQGREISRQARILGVVNTFSALVKQRAHRKAKTAQEAVEILHSLADKKFDATVVDSLEAVIRSYRGREILISNGVEI